MRAAAIWSIVGVLALCACARQADAPPAPAKKPATPTGTAAMPPTPPSYEVSIASAQADRVRALNGCDAKQGAPRAACVRAADSAYDAARAAAEKIREHGR